MSKLALPSAPGWEIEFSRIARDVKPRLKHCAAELGNLFRAAGNESRFALRLTAIGITGSLTVLGQRAPLLSFEFHLVDGLAAQRTPGARLEVNLLNANAKVVAFCTPLPADSARPLARTAPAILSEAQTVLCASHLYCVATEHFDLLAEGPRQRAR
jgi:hypothetical protein